MRKLLFLFACMICAVSSAFAQNNEAMNLVDKLYVLPGQMPIKDMIIELESFRTDGDTKNMVLESKDKIYLQNPAKIRTDVIISDPQGQLDGKQMTIVRDGKSILQYLSTGQYPVKKLADNTSQPLGIPYGAVKYQQNKDKTYSMAGKETVDGIAATKVSIKSTDENVMLWIDTKRAVVLKATIERKGKTTTTKTVVYKDIKPTKEGRYFAMRIEVSENNTLQRMMVYKGLVVNAGLDDSLFTPYQKFMK